ncbi:MAG: haloalkane dehalogenase [Parvularculaceae bacterium]|nr:haloalkane dehalogenase [Parvularculaceae bacterium]
MSPVEILRTPDARFESIPDYPFRPNFVDIVDIDIGALRQHYLDEGSGPAVLLMHGEPTWSFLYRKMIPVLVDAGYRVVVPDLIGFGKSDKPADRAIFSYSRHVAWLRGFLDALNLRSIRLFAQDWGGLLSLRIVAAEPDRFEKVAIANTGLPDGRGLSEAFAAWRAFARSSPEFPIGRIVAGGCAKPLGEREIAAYDAPFPDERYKAAARVFPSLVPVEPMAPGAVDNMAAWRALEHFQKPFLTLFSDQDPVTGGAERRFKESIPGARGQAHAILSGGGHFLQEDLGVDLADRLALYFAL